MRKIWKSFNKIVPATRFGSGVAQHPFDKPANHPVVLSERHSQLLILTPVSPIRSGSWMGNIVMLRQQIDHQVPCNLRLFSTEHVNDSQPLIWTS